MDFTSLFNYCPVCGSADFIGHSVKSKQCGRCGFEFFMNAAAAVATFIVNEAGDLLVCRRAKEPAKGMLDLAGGFVDADETVENALKREINEELGAQVTNARYLFSLPNRYEYCGLAIPTLDLFFECKLLLVNDLVPSDDVEECFFVPLKDINVELFGLNSIREGVAKYLKAKLQTPTGTQFL